MKMAEMEVASVTSTERVKTNIAPARAKTGEGFPPGTSPAKDGENIQTQLQEEYLKTLEQLEEGQLVEGKVIQVTADQVFIDVGYKSEGKIPLSEFSGVPNIGDAVPVILIAKETNTARL